MAGSDRVESFSGELDHTWSFQSTPDETKDFLMPILRIAIASFIFFGLDRLSKIIIVQWLNLAAIQKLPGWPPYLNFVMAWNKGINFGFLGSLDARWLLVAISVGASFALALWVRNKSGWALLLASGAVIGGALGNAYDRIVYGAVADYINVSCCTINNPYSFNVADVLIFGGVIFLFLIHESEKKRMDGKHEPVVNKVAVQDH